MSNVGAREIERHEVVVGDVVKRKHCGGILSGRGEECSCEKY